MSFIPFKTLATSVCGSTLVSSTQGGRCCVYFLTSKAPASWSRSCYSPSAVFMEPAEQAGGRYLPVHVGAVEVGRVGVVLQAGWHCFCVHNSFRLLIRYWNSFGVCLLIFFFLILSSKILLVEVQVGIIYPSFANHWILIPLSKKHILGSAWLLETLCLLNHSWGFVYSGL